MLKQIFRFISDPMIISIRVMVEYFISMFIIIINFGINHVR